MNQLSDQEEHADNELLREKLNKERELLEAQLKETED